MRTAHLVAVAALLSVASPAAAQLRNRSISVESGVSAPISAGSGARGVLALAATTWLDGAAEAVVRVAVAAAPETAGRSSAAVAGTVGVRMSLLPDPLRPQLGVELGWAREDRPTGTADRIAFGVTAGLEWFPGRDLSVAARGAMRGVGSALSLDLVLALAAYF
jgi:hypothetical protein